MEWPGYTMEMQHSYNGFSADDFLATIKQGEENFAATGVGPVEVTPQVVCL